MPSRKIFAKRCHDDNDDDDDYHTLKPIDDGIRIHPPLFVLSCWSMHFPPSPPLPVYSSACRVPNDMKRKIWTNERKKKEEKKKKKEEE